MQAEKRSRLVPAKDLGAAALFRTLPPMQSRLALGRVYGKANRRIVRNTPTGDKYEGFSGIFEVQPFYDKYATAISPLLFLPDDVAELLREPFDKIKKENKRDMLVFRFEVSIVRAKNEPGYVLHYEVIGKIGKAEPIDPLGDVRAGFPLKVIAETVPARRRRAKGR